VFSFSKYSRNADILVELSAYQKCKQTGTVCEHTANLSHSDEKVPKLELRQKHERSKAHCALRMHLFY